MIMDISPDLFTNFKMNLLDVEDELRSKDFYGKLIEQSGDRKYVIRFTSIPPEISSYFHAFRKHGLLE